MSLTCQVCYNELETESIYKFACNCSCCEDCAAQHSSTEISKAPQHHVTSIQCPFGCSAQTLTENLVSSFKSSKSEEAKIVDQALFSNFCTRDKNVLKCPYKNCGYIGYYEQKLLCSNKVECLKCKKTWNVKSSSEIVSLDSYRTRVWRFIFTKDCPNCGMSINKTGGCAHMSCSCKYQFCWICKQNWLKHSVLIHYLMAFLLVGFYSTIILTTIYYVGAFGLIWIGLKKLFWLSLSLFTSQIFLTNALFKSLVKFYNISKRENKSPFKQILLLALIVALGYYTVPGLFDMSSFTKQTLMVEVIVLLLAYLNVFKTLEEIIWLIGKLPCKGLFIILLTITFSYGLYRYDISMADLYEIFKRMAYFGAGAILLLSIYRLKTRTTNNIHNYRPPWREDRMRNRC